MQYLCIKILKNSWCRQIQPKKLKQTNIQRVRTRSTTNEERFKKKF